MSQLLLGFTLFTPTYRAEYRQVTMPFYEVKLAAYIFLM